MDTEPRHATINPQYPSFTMGYKADVEAKKEERPAPGTYFSSILDKPRTYNRSQRHFTLTKKIDFAHNPKNPSVGQY